MRRWTVLPLAALVAVAGVLVARGDVSCDLLGIQPACEVALRPGPTEDTLTLVTVDGAPSYESAGSLLLTTVAVQEDLTLRTWFNARTSRVVDAVPRSQIYPPGQDRDEVAEQNAALMADSQLVATIAALTAAGYHLEGEGALVVAVSDDAVTGDLRPRDVIVAVDGMPVEDNRAVVEAVQAKQPSSTLDLDVAGEDGERSVEVTLGVSPEDPDVPYIGVMLSTELELPVDVSIDAGVIGGPSAGLMFALSIVDLLGPHDLTGGDVIAGTGTVDRDGVVGTVGGVRQKIVGATTGAAGQPATVFLVPTGNLAEARSAAVDRDVLLVPVDTLDDALDALTDLRAGREPLDALALSPGG